ncbi:uroporphyrinogen-III synthase [Candidatus Pelagibacter communis]|uniref:uroporphyrinogen-III synthase n=1 Tax=Pelagibacter ubique TaxID=198252 RepID=UPI00094BF265|nr:uroporphyrinogen-III synthase [Candidatus Pelagibacter ubique]
MHVLFTRPIDDSKDLILKFKSLGHIVSSIPVISIKKKEYSKIDFSSFKGIIFTSSNAIKFLDIKLLDKNIKCFCVGNATELLAKEKGFQNIFSAEGNVNNLKEIILQNFKSSEGKLLYISGETITFELDKFLISEGLNVKRVINYSSDPIEKFNEILIDDLKNNVPDIVYIYSQNSAISFKNLIKNYNLQNHWMNTNLMCISEKTSSVLNDIKWKKIFLFNPGEEEYLLYKI